MIQAKILFEENLNTGGAQIAPGVHGGVIFSGVVESDSYLDINFSNENKQGIRKRLFPPTGANPKEGQTLKEALAAEETQNALVLSLIIKAVATEDEFNSFGAASYSEFVTKAATLLNRYVGTKVNLVVVPAYKDPTYSDIPKYGRWIEKHQEGVEPTLVMPKPRKAKEPVKEIQGPF